MNQNPKAPSAEPTNGITLEILRCLLPHPKARFGNNTGIFCRENQNTVSPLKVVVGACVVGAGVTGAGVDAGDVRRIR